MGWRVISIESPAKLSLKDYKLVIEQDESLSIPLEDIDSLAISGEGIVLTKNIITALSAAKINVLLCDEKHLPCSMILPYAQASRGAKVARAQINMPEATRKQLWRKNIIQKITNQADVLAKHGYEDVDLRQLAKTVRSGDVGRNESNAARIYFDRLLGDATRRKPMWYNSALNYGYAIIRGALARSLVARGLISTIGINHHSELNQFNLVDDIIETFRPIIDDYVLIYSDAHGKLRSENENLTRADREFFLDILNKYAIIKDKKFELKLVADKVAESFVKAILEDNVEAFELPRILK